MGSPILFLNSKQKFSKCVLLLQISFLSNGVGICFCAAASPVYAQLVMVVIGNKRPKKLAFKKQLENRDLPLFHRAVENSISHFLFNLTLHPKIFQSFDIYTNTPLLEEKLQKFKEIHAAKEVKIIIHQEAWLGKLVFQMLLS